MCHSRCHTFIRHLESNQTVFVSSELVVSARTSHPINLLLIHLHVAYPCLCCYHFTTPAKYISFNHELLKLSLFGAIQKIWKWFANNVSELICAFLISFTYQEKHRETNLLLIVSSIIQKLG